MLPREQRLELGHQSHFMALAPDGRAIAFVARTSGLPQLHVRRLDRRSDEVMAGAEDAHDPFFSPDGEWLAYFDTQHLMKVSVRGGAPVPLAGATEDRGGVWLDDGTIVFGPDASSPLYRLPRDGGAPVAITTLDSSRNERTHRWPAAINGGPWVVFTVGLRSKQSDYDDADIDAVSLKTGERRTLIHGGRRALWAAPNHLVFDRKGTLFAVRIDPRDPRIRDEPVPVQDGVAGYRASGASFVDFARDGTMAWMPAEQGANMRQIGWLDRSGHWTPTPIPPGDYTFAVVSPDGLSALILEGASGGGEVCLGDLRTGAIQRFSYTHDAYAPVWFPDGTRYVYQRADSLNTVVLGVRRLDGVDGTRVVHRHPTILIATDVTPDGRAMVASDWGLTNGRMYLLRLDPEPGITPIPTEAIAGSYEAGGTLSPDGRWLAYISSRTGREEVFVRRVDGGGTAYQVSTRGANGVRWGRHGTELLFVEDRMLKSVGVTVGADELTLGRPVALFGVPSSFIENTFGDYSYDPRSDRFLFTRPPEGSDERREIALSIGWGRRITDLIRARKEKR